MAPIDCWKIGRRITMDLYLETWKSKKKTGDDFCACGSCGAHWEMFVGLPIDSQPCSYNGCKNQATLGGHIVNENYPEGYIVPLCDVCNQLDEPFQVHGNTLFVSADLSITRCDEEEHEEYDEE